MKTLLLTLIPAERYRHDIELRMQENWADHAAYMDKLTESGFIIFGGPAGNGWARLLVVKTESENEVYSTFAHDPWIVDKMLRIAKIEPWEILLHGKDRSHEESTVQKSYYLVRRKFGPNWNYSLKINEQENWKGHADFMDGLAEDGILLFGGPIGYGSDVQFIGKGENMRQVLERLSEDPWRPVGLLEEVGIERWDVLLGKPV